MTEHEEISKTLKDEIKSLIERLEQGREVLVRSGYVAYTNRERIIYRYCETIVQKLISLGYSYSTNHGHGCKDYHFTKKIEI